MGQGLYNAGAMVGKPFIHAYLVGMNICKGGVLGNDPKNENGETIAKLTITTFAQLVDTAERRLFNLRITLADRYDDVPGMELFNRLNEQLTL